MELLCNLLPETAECILWPLELWPLMSAGGMMSVGQNHVPSKALQPIFYRLLPWCDKQTPEEILIFPSCITVFSSLQHSFDLPLSLKSKHFARRVVCSHFMLLHIRQWALLCTLRYFFNSGVFPSVILILSSSRPPVILTLNLDSVFCVYDLLLFSPSLIRLLFSPLGYLPKFVLPSLVCVPRINAMITIVRCGF